MNLEKALTLYLGGLDQAVITAYEFGLILLEMYRKKKFHGNSLGIQKDIPGMPEIRRYLDGLKEAGILDPLKEFPEDKVFSIIGKSDFSPKEVACVVDPFAYVSHASAMEYHGLSDRMPKTLFISTLPAPLWGKKAKEKMEKDYAVYLSGSSPQLDLPKLTRVRFEKIKGTPISRYQSKNIGSFISVDKKIRVSSIGRTFLDMVREPTFCGGIRHVLDVFKDNAKGYRKLIIDEIDRNGTAIEKARAGYLLEDFCNVRDPKIDEWAKHVMRGGSRKLDPNEAFSSEFSERWCISINC